MNVQQIAGFVRSWPDALILSEVVGNPFLRVTEDWDFHDWEVVEEPGGMRFQHHDSDGRITETVFVACPLRPDGHRSGDRMPVN